MQIKRSLYLYTAALRRAVAGVLCALPLLAAADADCPRAEAKSADGMQIEFKQYQFPDGTADLILRHAGENGAMEIRRVTYGGSKTETCQYQSLAIVPGGGEKQWGWHLAWAGAKGLRYARMDGNA